MESAVTVCIAIAKKIYAMAQMAKNNKAQSLLLGERVNRISEQLQRMDLLRVQSKSVEELHNVLEAALDLIANHDSQSFLFKVFRSGANAERFEEIHARISRVQEELGIQAVAEIASLGEQLRAAAKSDQRAFEELSKQMDAHHGDLVAHMLGMEETLAQTQEKLLSLGKIYECVKALRIDSGVSSGGPSRSSSSSHGGGATAAGPAEIPAPQWRINYDALEFAVNKRGQRVRIGKGTFGEVYKAILGERETAVKEFTHEFLKEAKCKNMFIKEVQLLHRLHHPNLVELYGACELYTDDTYPFLAMEFLPITLYAALYIDEKVKDYPTTIRLARDIAAALEYLHGSRPQRIVHHDVKPDNVMLTADLRAKLIDFGLASITSTIRTTSARGAIGDIVGTPGYMGPEKLQGLKNASSHLVDVFAYGITLWQLVTREKPYEDMDKATISKFILEEKRPSFPPSFRAKALVAVVQACWAGGIEERPEMGTILACLRACVREDTSVDVVRHLLSPHLDTMRVEPTKSLTDSEAALRAAEMREGPSGAAQRPQTVEGKMPFYFIFFFHSAPSFKCDILVGAKDGNGLRAVKPDIF